MADIDFGLTLLNLFDNIEPIKILSLITMD